MHSIDTSVLLRWLLRDVPKQADAVDKLLASGTQLRIDDAVVIETVYVLERVMRLKRATVDDSLRVIMSVANFDLNRTLWGRLMTIYTERPKLSITDIYLAAQSEINDATPLLTFDRKLATQLRSAELVK